MSADNDDTILSIVTFQPGEMAERYEALKAGVEAQLANAPEGDWIDCGFDSLLEIWLDDLVAAGKIEERSNNGHPVYKEYRRTPKA